MSFLKKRALSFVYAFSGIAQAFKADVNMRIHFLAVLVVCAAGFYFKVSSTEWLVLVGFMALVISLELVNSAIERFCDKLVPHYDLDVKFIKDVAAAAVLVASIGAVIAGVIIFWPYLL